MSEPLKACPFCGSGAVEIMRILASYPRTIADTYKGRCLECGSSGKQVYEYLLAAEAWNRRFSPAE